MKLELQRNEKLRLAYELFHVVPPIHDGDHQQVGKLLANGSVENLIQTGREPLRTGILTTRSGETLFTFVVPPEEVSHMGGQVESIDTVFGVTVWIMKDGRQLKGTEFHLTQTQAQEVEKRALSEHVRMHEEP